MADAGIRLGVNSVLFDAFDLATAARQVALCGYDGIELAAIPGMCEHLDLDAWHSQVAGVQQLVADHGLQLLSVEHGGIQEERMPEVFAAAAALGIAVVNVGPGGAPGDPDSLLQRLEVLTRWAVEAAAAGVTLCVKAHVGTAISDTPTTLAAMQAIDTAGFGIDMDPSHVHRAGEEPAEALRQVLHRVRHVHIRDCRGRQSGPGAPVLQACGRGDIDLMGYCRTLVEGGWSGPVCLEVIGAAKAGLSLAEVTAIAAESYGYLNACLKHLEAR